MSESARALLNLLAARSRPFAACIRVSARVTLAPVTINPGYEPEASRATRDGDVCLGRSTSRYNIALGARISRDPIAEMAGTNLYRYVNNGPVNRIDPLGLVDLDLHSPGDTPSVQVGHTLPDDSSTITVFAHGNPNIVDDERNFPAHSPIAQNPLGARALANLIKNLPDFPNANRVVLYSCETGRGPNPIAALLAKYLGLPVWAPDNTFWTTPGNRCGISGIFPPLLNGKPNKKEPGSYLRFDPPSK